MVRRSESRPRIIVPAWPAAAAAVSVPAVSVLTAVTAGRHVPCPLSAVRCSSRRCPLLLTPLSTAPHATVRYSTRHCALIHTPYARSRPPFMTVYCN